MRVIFINGRIERIAWRELLHLFRHPYTIALFFAGIFIFQLIAPASALEALGPVEVTLFWAHVVIVFFGTYLGIAWLWERWGLTLVTPLLVSLIAGVLTLTGTGFLVIAGGAAADPTAMLVFWLFLWALMQFCELLFVTFLYEALLQPCPPRGLRDREDATMTVAYVNGRQAQVTLAEALRILHHPFTTGMTLGAVAIFILIHPLALLSELPLHLVTLFWAQVLVMFFFLVQAIILICFRTGLTLVVPVALLLVALLISLTSAQVLNWMTGESLPLSDIVILWLFHWSIMVLAEFLVVAVVLDRVVPQPATVTDAEAPPAPMPPAPSADLAPDPGTEPQALRLQGVEVPAADVLLITAEEHYLRIVTPGRSRLLRGRMADVEGQLPPGLGLRVHRSHWVAARAVTGLRRAVGGWTLVLTDQSVVPVARARQTAVRDWVARIGPPRG